MNTSLGFLTAALCSAKAERDVPTAEHLSPAEDQFAVVNYESQSDWQTTAKKHLFY